MHVCRSNTNLRVDPVPRYQLEPVDRMDAEKLFDRRWALTLPEQARARLRDEYLETGKSSLYERLKVFESGGAGTSRHTQKSEPSWGLQRAQ